jgi:hypothetical protein
MNLAKHYHKFKIKIETGDKCICDKGVWETFWAINPMFAAMSSVLSETENVCVV